MKEFLGEDVTYVNNEQIDNAFRFFRNDPDATRDTIKKYFRQLKFFTNNDFAFVDVHNEKLFYQNAAVLLKLVKMLQDIRLHSDTQNQFLGDLFEGFLDSGVKQSEGQFFTPTPITKFILMSLPLESLVRDSQQPPRVIDYACGAGHFLNELATQIKPFVEFHKKADPKEFYKAIFGIEKEYRLSKVAKVSAFMYEQDEINIVYADALASHPQIEDGTFSVLVANPPFSVKGFLETLPEADRQRYTLFPEIDAKSLAKNNSIETFFIERAKQLLKPGGVAGIIVPSSILSNAKGAYVRTREILLQYFDVVAIAQFGSRTFGKTGTNTVTLFLRRKAEDPAPADHFRHRVDAWFKTPDDKKAIFADESIIRRYCAHAEIPFEHYQSLLRGEPSGELLAHERFADYRRDFDNLTENKALRKSKGFKALYQSAQEAALNIRFLAYLRRIEKDKLYHYALADTNPQPVVIVKSPTDTKAEKMFLGYDWSGAKGNEGIKYLTGGPMPKEKDEDVPGVEEDEEVRVLENLNNLARIQTPLYDPTDPHNPEKLNTYIQQAFLGEDFTVPEALAPFLSAARLVDMLDFSRVGLDKQFSLTPRRNIAIDTVWSQLKLGEIAQVKKGKSITQKDVSDGDVPVVAGGISLAYYHDTANRPANTITVSASGANAGYVNFWKVPIFASDCTTINAPTESLTVFIFNVLKYLQNDIFNLARGAAQPHVYPNDLAQIKIPLPPEEIQSQIVTECEAIDVENDQAKDAANAAKSAVESLVNDVYGTGYVQTEIDKLSLDVQYGINEAMNTGGSGFKIFRMNEIINRKMVDNGSMKYADISAEEFAKYKLNPGDLLFNRTNSIEHVGKTGIFDLQGDYCFASYLIRVVIDPAQADPRFVNLMMNSAAFQEEAKSKAARSINQANINATVMRNIKIPVPPLPEQTALVQAVEAFETRITEAQEVLDGAAARKQAVLKKYLTELPAAPGAEVPTE